MLQTRMARETVLRDSLVLVLGFSLFDLDSTFWHSVQDKSQSELPLPERLAVRVNAVNTPFFSEDIVQAVSTRPSPWYDVGS